MYKVQRWKPISKSKYFEELNKCGVLAPLLSNVRKELKKEFVDSFDYMKNRGILDQIRSLHEIEEKASDDDYNYYIEDGYDYHIICGEDMIDEINNNLIKNL